MTPDSQETKNQEAVDGKNSTNEMATEQAEENLDPKVSISEPVVEDTTETEPSSKQTDSITNPLLDYKDVGFSPQIQNVLMQAKWKIPRPLDGMALPHALKGEDLLIQAASKTSAIVFLTLAYRLEDSKGSSNGPQALVIYSSSEAAKKACQDFIRLFGSTGLSASSLIEDVEVEEGEDTQKTESLSSNILFASPAALKHASMKNQVSFDMVQICVCRDVDVVSQIASEDLRFVLSKLETAQKIFFSSTLSSSIQEFSSKYLRDAKLISLERERASISTVEHKAYLCETPNKFKVLLGVLRDFSPKCTMVFANSKLTASWLYHKLLENSFAVELVSSELPPSKREELSENVKSAKTKVLVATDFENRHFSFPEVTYVFNFDLPDSGDAYLARMGQVGKEEQGFVYSLVCEEYGQNYQHVYDLLGQKAPKPLWAKQEYSTIVDKSGNPFLEKNIFVEKRPSREFNDRPRRSSHEGERPAFQRKERHERPDRGDRVRERSDRPERISARPRIEERSEREFVRSERIEQRSDTSRDRMIRNDRSDRDEGRSNRSSGPQIKPRTRRMHQPSQVRPIEQQRRVIPKEPKRGILKKILSFFFSKKKKY